MLFFFNLCSLFSNYFKKLKHTNRHDILIERMVDFLIFFKDNYSGGDY